MWNKQIKDLGACSEAIDWIDTLPEDATFAAAWAQCPRADWLMWLSARTGVDRRSLVLAACACARTSLQYVREGEDRPRIAIETAEAWTRGEATIEQVRAAADAAVVAGYAAYAAAHAADSATHAAAAYAAAAAAAAAAAWKAAQARLAEIVRAILPIPRLGGE